LDAPLSRLRAVDSHDLAAQVSAGVDCLMDARRLTDEVNVNRANNDPSMFGLLAMQSNKIFSIQRQHGTIFRSC
jgi:hypothetical protein